MDFLFSRRFLWTSGSIVLCGAALLGFVFYQRATASRQYAAEVRRAAENAKLVRDSVVVYSEWKIRSGATFSDALQRMEVGPAQAEEIVRSASGVFDLRQVRAGGEIDVGRSVEGTLQEVRYRIDSDRMLSVRRRLPGLQVQPRPGLPGLQVQPRPGAIGSQAQSGAAEDEFAAEVQTIPSRTETIAVRGEIRDSLFAAVDTAGEGPELALRLAEIFGWDLDFYSDPRVGDTFRVQVEKKTSLDGKSRAYGQVIYAEYVNDGHPYRALLFHDADGKPAYFSPNGQSLQKAFLRSPLKFSAAVTSGFSRSRFHPVLHTQRAHLGTDYGAPIGTPVQAIGAGRVIFAGNKGDNGNMVQLRHSNGYESLYLHLSRVLVRTGDRVESGDRIGLVGMTGLATGPHLHFSILDHGVYRNFEVLRRNLPSAEPVARAYMAEFAALRENVMTQLDSGSMAAGAGAGSGTAPGLYSQPGQSKRSPLQPTSLR
jgi:murein DD-endopeptidase MepM/ murein hydrolase activator NlpD